MGMFDLSFDDGFDFGGAFDLTSKAVNDSAKIDEKVVEERAIRRKIKSDKLHFLVAKRLDDLCVRPKNGEQWRIVTEKAFNAYAFILSLLNDGEIDDLHIAIYRINEPTARSLIELIENRKIKHAAFVISNFFNQTKKPEKWAQMLAQYCSEHPDVTRFCYLHNHCKVVCAKSRGNYYVFEGSWNMSDNARIEQYTYENSRDVYDFHTSWINNLIDKTNGRG